MRQGLHDDKIERIKTFYLDPHPEPLAPADEETRERLEAIWRMATGDQKLLKDGALPTRSKVDLSNYIMKLWGISSSQAFYLIKQSEQVFGWINKVDKEGLRAMQTERYLRLLDLALKEDSHDLAVKLLERVDKINGLEEKTSQDVDINKLLSLLEVNVTTDPKVLTIEVEDAEEIDD